MHISTSKALVFVPQLYHNNDRFLFQMNMSRRELMIMTRLIKVTILRSANDEWNTNIIKITVILIDYV